jgi:excisionase family DNA binding protein
MELPELMTVRDFLDAFSIGRTTFYRQVESGRLKIVKLGRSTRIARSDAEAWLSSLRDSPTAEH